MVENGARHPPRASTRKLQSQRQINILAIAEEAFVKTADLDEVLSAVERAGGAGPHDVGVFDAPAGLPLQRPPGDAGHVPDISHPVEDLRIVEPDLKRAEACRLGVALRRSDQRLKPCLLYTSDAADE